MKRNSTQIEIITPGATTWLPWIDDVGANRVNGYPDFSGFSGASRAVRENTWQAFLDSNEPLEIIPDPEPVPEPSQPKWNDFNVYMLTDPDFTTYRATARAIDPELTSALFVAYGKVAEGGFSTFEAIWNQWVTISGVTPEGKNRIATVAEGFDLPEDFINILRGQ